MKAFESSDAHKHFPLEYAVAHLRQVLHSVFPGSSMDANSLEEPEAEAVWSQHKDEDQGRPKAVWDEDTKQCLCFFYGSGTTANQGPSRVYHLRMPAYLERPTGLGLQFLRMFMKELNKDIAVLSSCGHAWEDVWRALQATQMRRAIAHSVGFLAHDVDDWIALLEGVTSLTYEGTRSTMTVVFTRNIQAFRDEVRDSYVPLKSKLPLKTTLFSEKWLRAVVDGERVALVVRERSGGQISGLLSLSTLDERSDRYDYAPHESLRLLLAHLPATDLAVVAGENGDLYVLSGKGCMWRKHQGRWEILEAEGLAMAIRRYTGATAPVAREITRMCLDLAFERHGALICVIQEQLDDLSQMVVDFQAPERANAPLRRALTGISVASKWGHRQLVTSAAGTDGATILNQGGRLMDVACMIRDAPEELIRRYGYAVRRAFPGARSRAAWNASFFGLAIKVSEDGPITLWFHGHDVSVSSTPQQAGVSPPSR